MPIYAYRCSECGQSKDVLQKLSDPQLTVCPFCGKPAFHKQVTAAGFQLKGSGWYATDFKGGNSGAPAKAEGDSDGKSAGAPDAAKDGKSGKDAAKDTPAATPAAPSTPAAPAAKSEGSSGSGSSSPPASSGH